MWQRIKASITSAFTYIPRIGTSKRNFLMISADIRGGTVIVSYKGKIKTGVFSDKTLRHMMNGVHFEKNAESFLSAVAQLIRQVTNE